MQDTQTRKEEKENEILHSKSLPTIPTSLHDITFFMVTVVLHFYKCNIVSVRIKVQQTWCSDALSEIVWKFILQLALRYADVTTVRLCKLPDAHITRAAYNAVMKVTLVSEQLRRLQLTNHKSSPSLSLSLSCLLSSYLYLFSIFSLHSVVRIADICVVCIFLWNSPLSSAYFTFSFFFSFSYLDYMKLFGMLKFYCFC